MEKNKIIQLTEDDFDFARRIAYKIGYSFLSGIGKEQTLQLEDLQQEAIMGMLEAASRYDDESVAELRTYAYSYIKKRVGETITKYRTPLTVSKRFSDTVTQMSIEAEGGEEERYNGMDKYLYQISKREEALCEHTEECLSKVNRAMAVLSEREREVISLSFGLDDGEAHVSKDIAELLHISPARVCQVKERSLTKMERVRIA